MRRTRATIAGRRNGVLISNEQGEAVAYALWNLEERGAMFVEPGEKVYQGMIIGENAKQRPRRQPDEGQAAHQHPHPARRGGAPHAAHPMTLEKAIAYIEDDELVEVTPKSIRLARRCSTRTTGSARCAPRRPRPSRFEGDKWLLRRPSPRPTAYGASSRSM